MLSLELPILFVVMMRFVIGPVLIFAVVGLLSHYIFVVWSLYGIDIIIVNLVFEVVVKEGSV